MDKRSLEEVQRDIWRASPLKDFVRSVMSIDIILKISNHISNLRRFVLNTFSMARTKQTARKSTSGFGMRTQVCFF